MNNDYKYLKGKEARKMLLELLSPTEQPRKNAVCFIDGYPFLVQAYEKDNFVNLSPTGKTDSLGEALYNVRVNFLTGQISTDGKETPPMKKILSILDAERVEMKMLDIFEPVIPKYQNELKDCKCFGYFLNGNLYTAFDNRSRDCNVEDFGTEEEAVRWLDKY